MSNGQPVKDDQFPAYGCKRITSLFRSRLKSGRQQQFHLDMFVGGPTLVGICGILSLGSYSFTATYGTILPESVENSKKKWWYNQRRGNRRRIPPQKRLWGVGFFEVDFGNSISMHVCGIVGAYCHTPQSRMNTWFPKVLLKNLPLSALKKGEI